LPQLAKNHTASNYFSSDQVILMCMQNLLEARSADNLKGDVMGDVFDHPICASFGTV